MKNTIEHPYKIVKPLQVHFNNNKKIHDSFLFRFQALKRCFSFSYFSLRERPRYTSTRKLLRCTHTTEKTLHSEKFEFGIPYGTYSTHVKVASLHLSRIPFILGSRIARASSLRAKLSLSTMLCFSYFS